MWANNRQWRAGAAVLTLACGMAARVAVAADLADRVPDNTLLAIEWSKIGENNALVDIARAIANAPFLADEHDRDLIEFRQFLAFAELATRHTGIVAVVPGGPDGHGEPQMMCVVDAGADAVKLAEAVKQALKTDNESLQPEAVTIGGVGFTRYGAHPDATHVGVQKDLVFATWGRQAAEALTAPDKIKPLSKQAEYAHVHQKLKAEGPWRAGLFVNVEAGMALASANHDNPQNDAKRIMEALGLNAFRSFFLQLDSNSLGTRMTWYIHGPTKSEGVAKFWRQKPLADADLGVIPRDPYWASAAKLDLAELYQEAMAVGEKIDPSVPATVNGAMAMVQGMLGFSPSENLLPAFGDTWVMYDGPEQGGLLFTGMVLINNVRDEAGLQGMLQRTLDYITPLAAQNKVQIVRKEMKHGGQTVHYVLIGGLPVPIAPAWAFVGKQWVFGLAPQTVAAALTQIDPATRKQSLLDNADYKAARAQLPKELTAVHYADARNAYKTFYPLMLLAKTAAASASAGSAQPFDLEAVPTFSEKLNGLHSMVAGTSLDSEGIVTTCVGVSPGAFLLAGNLDAGTIGLMTAVLMPSLSRAREMAKRTVCAANARGFGVGCQIYANDNKEKFPPDPKALVDLGMCTPQMLICPDADVTDADVKAYLDGKGSIGWTYITGQSAKGDVQNVLMFEDLAHHNGEGANVLFLDSHVEFMHPGALKSAVRATYKRLGREAEVPVDFND